MQPSRGFILLLGFLIGLTPLAIDMYLPALPGIGRELEADPEWVQNSVSIYLAFFAVTQLVFGPISDTIGRRPTIFGGLLLFLIGSLLCATAQNIGVLLFARALQGAAAAAISVSVPALVKDRFSGAVYTSTMGFIMIVMSVAPLIAPIIGGFIIGVANWRWIFYLLLITTALCLALFLRFIPETLPADQRQPLALGHVLRNYWRLCCNRQSLCLVLCAGFVVGGLMTYITTSPHILIEYYGVPKQYYGFFFAINVLVMTGVTYLSNRLVHHYGNVILLRVFMFTIFSASCLLLTLSRFETPSFLLLNVAVALFVANLGAVTSNVQTVVFSQFPSLVGAASAFVGFFRFGVGALAGAVASSLYDGTSAPLTVVMGGCGLLCVTAFLFSGAASYSANNATSQ